MNLNSLSTLCLTAVAASIALLARRKERIVPGVALALAAWEFLRTSGVLRVQVRGLDLGLVAGVSLAVLGGVLLGQEKDRVGVASATVVAMAGALLALNSIL